MGTVVAPLSEAIARALPYWHYTLRNVFAKGQQGVWYDPSDLSTLFQDSAGTIPVTGTEQPVGLMLDKSGNGNHATQPTASKRPVLSSRVNLLTWSEDFSNAAWVKSNCSVSGSLVTATTTGAELRQDATGIGGTITVTYYARKGSGPTEANTFQLRNQSTATTLLGVAVNYDTLAIVYLTGSSGASAVFTESGVKITLTLSGIAAGSVIRASALWNGSAIAGTNAYLDKAQVNYGPTALPYQRITTATSYDTAGFPLYLKGDGVDDFMSTAAIDFSGTDKLSVWVGVTKLNDTVRIVAELSATVIGNSGSFFVVSGTDGVYTQAYTSISRGTSSATPGQIAAYAGAPAPDTAALTITHDISGDLSTIKRNGVAGVNGTFDKGAGNFGNHPLYIASRAGTSLFFNGNLYQLVIAGALYDADTVAKMNAWTAKKTGVTI